MCRESQFLIRILDSAYSDSDHAWHGPTLSSSILVLPLAEVIWRPGGAEHNIWEIALHTGYWKHVALSGLTGAKQGSFPRSGSDWFVRPGEDGDPWPEDILLLDRLHADLIAAVALVTPEALEVIPDGSQVSNFTLISGVAAHDAYHAGQIQSIRQWYNAAQ